MTICFYYQRSYCGAVLKLKFFEIICYIEERKGEKVKMLYYWFIIIAFCCTISKKNYCKIKNFVFFKNIFLLVLICARSILFRLCLFSMNSLSLSWPWPPSGDVPFHIYWRKQVMWLFDLLRDIFYMLEKILRYCKTSPELCFHQIRNRLDKHVKLFVFDTLTWCQFFIFSEKICPYYQL